MHGIRLFFQDFFYFVVGIGFLLMAKAKHLINGYTSPKPFLISESNRCIDYDFSVVDRWLFQLREYLQTDTGISDKHVLELGPGSDLGIGIYLLLKGCKKYNACDVNDLMKSTPYSFYEALFKKFEKENPNADLMIKSLQRELKDGKDHESINYVVRNDFDLVAAFGDSVIDIIFSHAAFEHFDDINNTISQLSLVSKPGATLIAEIDLQTHSRWIRDKDPNNIYRYPQWLYNIFWFRGIPNRVRPNHYVEALRMAGWVDIKITPLLEINGSLNPISRLARIFANESSQMKYLTFSLCAKNGKTI